MMLSEVALGATPHTVRQANSNLPKGMKKKEISTKGEGKYVPDPAQDYTFPDGTVVPRGKPVATEGLVRRRASPHNHRDAALTVLASATRDLLESYRRTESCVTRRELGDGLLCP